MPGQVLPARRMADD